MQSIDQRDLVTIVRTIHQYIKDDVTAINLNIDIVNADIVIKDNLREITGIDDWVDLIACNKDAEALSFNNLDQSVVIAITEEEILNQSGVINGID